MVSTRVIQATGVVVLALAVGLSGVLAVEVRARSDDLHQKAGHAEAAKHGKKHKKKHKKRKKTSKPGKPTGSPSPNSVPLLKIDSAVLTPTGTPDFVGGASDQVDVTFTVTTQAPATDGALIYLTTGSCFSSISDANAYTTNEFIAGKAAAVGDGTIASYSSQPASSTPIKGETMHKVAAVAAGYSTVCVTMWYRQFPDPTLTYYTTTPYFTMHAPLTGG
jgi:hypothetical protein